MKRIVVILRVLALLLLVASSFSLFAGCKEKTVPANPSDRNVPVYVLMEFAGYGNIVLKLDPENAPITVNNFVSLVREGYYDGLTITRIQENFVIQGGQGVIEKTPIRGEFSENGVNNRIAHEKGVISMARTNDPNSATTQFFICLDTDTCRRSLDGKYAGFGKVISGMANVDRMVAECANYGNPYNMGFIGDPADQPVIRSARVITAQEAEAYPRDPS